MNPDPNPVFLKRKRKILEEVENNFSPFHIYLWIHFIGYTEKFHLSTRRLTITVISLVLSIVNEGYSAIFIITKILYMTKHPSKDSLLSCLAEIGEFTLRFLVIFNRNRIGRTVKQLSAIYAAQVKKNSLFFKTKSASILLATDVFFFVWLIVWYLGSDPNAEVFEYLAEDHFYFIPPPYAMPLSYALNFMHYLNFLNPFVTILFCCMCHTLKHALAEFKKNLLRDRDWEANHVFRGYSEITGVIRSVNDTLHDMLLLDLTILLTWIFSCTYNLTFVGRGSALDFFSTAMVLISVSTKFSMICLYGSAVTKAMSEVNEVIFHFPLDAAKSGYLRFLLNANKEFHGLKLFDRIVIDKSLILTAVGSLLTYGILIATFNVSS